MNEQATETDHESPPRRGRFWGWLLLYLLLCVVALLGWLYYRSIPKTAAEQFARAEKLEQELARSRGSLEPAERERFRKRVQQAYEQVFERFPDPRQEYGPRAHRRLAKLAEEDREHERAVEWYKKSARRYPKDAHAADDLEHAAELLEKELRQYGTARELYRELAREHAADGRAPRWLYRAAELYDRRVKGRKPERAIEGYLEVVRRFPRSEQAPQALYQAARVHESAGAWKEAISLYERIEREYPKSPWAPRAMRRHAELLADQLKLPKQAAEVFRRLIEKYPQSKEAAYARGRGGKLEKQAAAKETEKLQSGRYGGGGGGTIYDPAAQWTEAKKKLYREIAAQQLDVETLDCRIVFDPPGKQARFEVGIALTNRGKPRKDLLFFFGDEFTVERAALDGKPVRHDHAEQRLKLFLDRPLPAGAKGKLSVKYKLDQSKTKLGPLYLVKLEQAGFAMADAGWYPGNVMGDLFRFQATFRIPQGYTVVSLGVPAGEKTDGKTSEFRWTSDHPVFGLYFAYGKYRSRTARWGAVDLRLLTFDRWSRAEKLLQAAREVLEFYSKRFGAYPYKKLWIAEVPLAGPFSGVGPASLLFLNRVHFEQAKVPWTVLAHEVAHQWWGNQVPISLFSVPGYSQWLSEGFASYSEAMFTEHREGREKFQQHLLQQRQVYLDVTRTQFEHPLARALGGGPGYVATVYMKGCWVLHMLRWLVGDRAFDRSLATYLERYRWKGSTVDDFRKICEEVSGQRLEAFFREWVDGIGCARYDLARVARKPAAAPDTGWKISFELKQRSTKITGKPPGPGEPPPLAFSTPVELLIEGQGKDQRRIERIAVERNPQQVELRLPFEPRRIVVDPGDRLLKVPGPHNRHELTR